MGPWNPRPVSLDLGLGARDVEDQLQPLRPLQHGLQLVHVVSARVERTQDRAHARADDERGAEVHLLQESQHPDVGKAPGSPSSQNQGESGGIQGGRSHGSEDLVRRGIADFRILRCRRHGRAQEHTHPQEPEPQVNFGRHGASLAALPSGVDPATIPKP